MFLWITTTCSIVSHWVKEAQQEPKGGNQEQNGAENNKKRTTRVGYMLVYLPVYTLVKD